MPFKINEQELDQENEYLTAQTSVLNADNLLLDFMASPDMIRNSSSQRGGGESDKTFTSQYLDHRGRTHSKNDGFKIRCFICKGKVKSHVNHIL